MRLFLLLSLAGTLALHAEEPAFVDAETRWTAERWKLPFANETMDLVGLQVHRTWQSGAYAGFGGWGSVRGERGGFITIGVSGGWRFPITERLALDTGLWLGGGGAGRADVGGGLMVRGHAGMSRAFDWARLGVEASRVRFPNGRVDSSQVAMTATFPFKAIVGSGRSDLPALGRTLGTELGWREFSLAFTGQRYAPTRSVRSLHGVPDTDPVELVGLEAHLGLGRGLFALWDMSAAAGGKADGYMDILMGLGYALPLDREGHWTLVSKFCGGPAGGGNLDVGGGMAWKGMLGLQLTTGTDFQFGLNAGYGLTPGGSFKGRVYQVQAGRRFALAAPGLPKAGPVDAIDFSGWSIRAGWQRLASPQRRGGAESDPIDLTSLQLTHELDEAWYFAGQGNFGLTGQAGGFAEGLLGLGWRSREFLGAGPRLLIQCMAGAAGGGGVDTAGGLLVQPTLGLEQALGKGLSLQVMTGRCIAPRGKLRTQVLDAGLDWRFGLPTRARR
jgi:hypothetical protein